MLRGKEPVQTSETADTDTSNSRDKQGQDEAEALRRASCRQNSAERQEKVSARFRKKGSARFRKKVKFGQKTKIAQNDQQDAASKTKTVYKMKNVISSNLRLF